MQKILDTTELFAREPIRTISDLKGKRVALTNANSGEHLYISIMATHIGLDAKKDINWIFSPAGDAMERFIAGDTDAFLGFRPSRRNCVPAELTESFSIPPRTDPCRTTSAV